MRKASHLLVFLVLPVLLFLRPLRVSLRCFQCPPTAASIDGRFDGLGVCRLCLLCGSVGPLGRAFDGLGRAEAGEAEVRFKAAQAVLKDMNSLGGESGLCRNEGMIGKS